MEDTYYPRQAVTRISLDLSIHDVQKAITVTQGDTNRRIEVTLVDGWRSFEVPETWSAALAGSTPSGDDVYESCQVINGRVIYDFVGSQIVAGEPGTSMYSFDVFDEDGNVIASPKIWIKVLRSTRRFEQNETIQRLSILQEFVDKANKTEGNT